MPDAIGGSPRSPSPSTSGRRNIGARRLHTVMERLLDDLSFNATRHTGESINIDAAYVDARLKDIARRRESRPLHPLGT
jgi:ATP-dependent HslUV protease ATP-binding subunit HslU